MSISKVNPDWSLGQKLTSDQMDALENNIVSALDKRAGHTDSLQSVVSIPNGGQIDITGTTAKIRAHANGAAIVASASGAMIAATANGAKIRTQTGGRIELGDNDYPTLSGTHTGQSFFRLVRAATAHVYGSLLEDSELLDIASDPTWLPFNTAHVTYRAGGVRFTSVDTAQSAASNVVFVNIDPWLQDGATLTLVTVRLKGSGSHVALPGRMPRFAVARIDNAATSQLLHNDDACAIDDSANAAAFATVHNVSGLTDANNVIAKASYSYWIAIANEGGPNSLTGLEVTAILLTQTITDLRPH